jgi:dTDP-4-dehydrorhamnose 3,5-epimerase-like enzyme
LWNDPQLGIEWPLTGSPLLASAETFGGQTQD